MTSFKSLRTQVQALLNLHRDDNTVREILDVCLSMTRICGDLQRQVKALENEVRALRNKT